MDPTDFEIISQCLSGNKDVFTVIVTRYKRLVHSVILSITGGTSEASDLSQEVFLRVYRSLHRYNPEYRFATWVIKISTNVCLDRMRRRKNEPLPIDACAEACDIRSNPELQHIEKEGSQRIRQAIRELHPKYRLPVVLFHQQGLSYRELEEVLNLPETIIKNRLYRARLMLREKLRAEAEVL